jgi:hypothetical protein
MYIGAKIMVMSKTNRRHLIIVSSMLLSVGFTNQALSQPECMAWGNLTGIRVEGQLIEFESSLCLIGSDLMQVTQTAKEQQRPDYRLEGNRQTIKTSLGDISFIETVEELGDGKALLNVEAKAETDTIISGAFFCLEILPTDISDVKIELIDSTASAIAPIPSFQGRRWGRFNRNMQASAKGARIITQHSKIEVMINESTEILVQRGNRFFGTFGNTRIYFGVMPGAAKKGQTAEKDIYHQSIGSY